MITIQLTQDEAQALVQLLDIAVKAGGLRAAKSASVIADRIDAAAKVVEGEQQ